MTNSSATLIDHIYTNDITSSFRSGIIINDVADHLGTFCIFHDKTKKIKPKQIKKRIFNKTNTNTFYRKLENTDFSEILKIDCPDWAYNKFMDIYLAEFDASFPMREVSSRAKFIKRQPWFTTGLLTSSINKGKLFSLKLHNPTDENIRKYKIYNKVFNKLKRKMKTLYFKTILEENRNNSRKCWSILKSAIGKTNDKSSFPLSFTINNSKISDKSEIVEGFNNFFSNIGLTTSHNVPPSKYPFSSYMSPRNMQSIFLGPVAPSDVSDSAKKLKSKLSSGHDNISTKLMKYTLNYIIEPITHIINQSLCTGIVPTDMKIAKVVPIYKSSDSTILKNYRPVSLLPAFSKLLEKIVFKQLMSFLTGQNILYDHQYGFRPKHATIHPIIHLLNHCASSSSKHDPETTLAILCDLSKAFDVIDHDILLSKMNNYGIRGLANDWFKNYLSCRQQYVDIDGITSHQVKIQIWVPQGSILGPLLFLLYVNDIGNSCHGMILSFADDTTLITSSSNLNELFTNANVYINNLYEWFCSSRLSLNANKTKYIVLRPRHTREDLS